MKASRLLCLVDDAKPYHQKYNLEETTENLILLILNYAIAQV